MENELLEDLIYWKSIVYDYTKNKMGNKYDYVNALKNINEIERQLEYCY